MRRLLLSACLLACAAVALADDKDKKDRKDDKTKSEPTVVPVEIAVSRGLGKEYPFQYQNDNTRLVFLLRYPGKQMLGVDFTAGKVKSFEDDKGNSLLDDKNKFSANFNTYGAALKDRAAMLLTVAAYGKAPGKGATKVRVKGEAVIRCGTDEKTEATKKFKFEAKAKATAGDFEIAVTSEKGFGNQGPTFTMTGKTNAIKSFVVKDGEGKEVEVYVGFGFGTPEKWTSNYSLAKPLAEGTIHVTYFSKEEKVKVPIDLSIGLGVGD
jgi:hypothetical protein